MVDVRGDVLRPPTIFVWNLILIWFAFLLVWEKADYRIFTSGYLMYLNISTRPYKKLQLQNWAFSSAKLKC